RAQGISIRSGGGDATGAAGAAHRPAGAGVEYVSVPLSVVLEMLVGVCRRTERFVVQEHIAERAVVVVRMTDAHPPAAEIGGRSADGPHTAPAGVQERRADAKLGADQLGGPVEGVAFADGPEVQFDPRS